MCDCGRAGAVGDGALQPASVTAASTIVVDITGITHVKVEEDLASDAAGPVGPVRPFDSEQLVAAGRGQQGMGQGVGNVRPVVVGMECGGGGKVVHGGVYRLQQVEVQQRSESEQGFGYDRMMGELCAVLDRCELWRMR